MEIAISLIAGFVLSFLFCFSAQVLREAEERPLLWGTVGFLSLILDLFLLLLSPWGWLAVPIGFVARVYIENKRKGPDFIVSERE